MFPVRAFGHARPPGVEKVLELARRHHLSLTPARAEFLAGVVAGVIDSVNHLDDLDEPTVELRHTDRDPGRPPRAGEDPHNAYIRFCTVRGAADGPLHGKTL